MSQLRANGGGLCFRWPSCAMISGRICRFDGQTFHRRHWLLPKLCYRWDSLVCCRSRFEGAELADWANYWCRKRHSYQITSQIIGSSLSNNEARIRVARSLETSSSKNAIKAASDSMPGISRKSWRTVSIGFRIMNSQISPKESLVFWLGCRQIILQQILKR